MYLGVKGRDVHNSLSYGSGKRERGREKRNDEANGGNVNNA